MYIKQTLINDTRYYKSYAQIDGSKLQKYKNIAPSTTTMGKGLLMEVTNSKKDYVYLDDSNE